VLESDGTSLHWTIVRVPFEPAQVWPKRQKLRVRGTIAGLPGPGWRPGKPSGSATGKPAVVALRTSLMRGRDGRCFLLVNRQMQKEAGVSVGSAVEVVLEPDLEEGAVATPPELEALLRGDLALRRFHGRLSPSYRKAMANLIAQPKSGPARVRRAERIAEWMLLAMEGERVPPPILEAAFRQQPLARAGWRAMTPVQRRAHLLGIFHYQSPTSRQKRARQAVEAALRRVGKGRGKSEEQ